MLSSDLSSHFEPNADASSFDNSPSFDSAGGFDGGGGISGGGALTATGRKLDQTALGISVASDET
jgi:hypothetical protein